MNQTGGVKKKDKGKTDKQRLYDMLESPGAIIRVLAWGSLKCFVIEFTLADPAYSEYMDLQVKRSGNTGNKFNVPVTKYVLKIIITHDNRSHDIHQVYTDAISNKQYSKESEVPQDVGFEVYTQTSAFQNSCTRGRVPVCPSPASMLFFDNESGKRFTTFLQQKVCGTQNQINLSISDDRNRMFQVCGYIMRRLHDEADRGICLVLMPKVGIQGMPEQLAVAVPTAVAVPQLVTDPITFSQFMDLSEGDIFMGLPVTTKSRDDVRALLIASVMKLFLAGISHLDLHGGNIMISVTQRGELKINILDLGNSCIFWSEIPNRFLDNPSQEELTDLLLGTKEEGVAGSGEESFRDKILGVDQRDFGEKRHIVSELLDKLQEIDRTGNERVFPNYHDHDPTRNQMRWWDRIRELSLDPRNKHRYEYIIGRAFDIVQAEEIESVHVNGRSTLNMSTLVDLYESGDINGFDDFIENGDFDIRPYIVVWDYTASPADIMNADASNAGMIVGPGGGARKKTSKKHKIRKNKTKKIALRKSKRRRMKK